MKIKLPFAQKLLAIGLLVLAAFLYFRMDWSDLNSVFADNAANPVNSILNQKAAVVAPGIESNSGRSAKELLTESANRLANSDALRAAARLTVNLFQQGLVANGQYSQLGQGSGFAKLEFDVGDDENRMQIVQICNRGIYYRFQTTPEDPTLQIADLRRISETDAFDLFANQNTWMATGGISSLIENLVQNFEFESVKETKIGETPVYKIRGKWNEDRLKRFLFGQVKHVAIKDGVDWRELPVHIPQYCEVLIGNDDYFPLFPYRITFLKQPFDDTDKFSEPIAIVSLDLYELEKNAQLQSNDFDVNFGGTPPNDLTKTMVDRIEILNQIQRSALKTKSVEQTR